MYVWLIAMYLTRMPIWCSFFSWRYTRMQQFYGSIIRRQRHLIRCLGGDHRSNSRDTLLLLNNNTRMQSVMSGANPALEADALSILRSISPTLDSTKHKGQAGESSLQYFKCNSYNRYQQFYVNLLQER